MASRFLQFLGRKILIQIGSFSSASYILYKIMDNQEVFDSVVGITSSGFTIMKI